MKAHEIDPQVYSQQLTEKSEYIDELFVGVARPGLEIFQSPPTHYRQRTEFRLWHDGDDLYYVMFKPETREPYRVDQIPPGSLLINQLMPLLISAIKNNPVLRKKIFQIDFLTTLSGEALVSLLYHRKLDDQWIDEARALRERFIEQGFHLDFIGRARKQKILLDRDFVLEQLQVDGRVLTYKQIENSFTQPNAKVAEHMLEWTLDCTRESTGDLLELYCGNGNFSLALSPNFTRVLATEQSRPSVNAARFNCAANEIGNVDIVRLSAEELTAAIEGRGQFSRLKKAGVDLSSFNCSTVLVDPPRAGVDERTCGLLQTYERILYISCNPQTLLANLETLLETHQIERMALFDQFPYTHHIELGVLLVRKE